MTAHPRAGDCASLSCSGTAHAKSCSWTMEGANDEIPICRAQQDECGIPHAPPGSEFLAAIALGSVLLMIGGGDAYARQCRPVGSNCRSNAECCSTSGFPGQCEVPPGKCVCGAQAGGCVCADGTFFPLFCTTASECEAATAECLADPSCVSSVTAECNSACADNGGAATPPIGCECCTPSEP